MYGQLGAQVGRKRMKGSRKGKGKMEGEAKIPGQKIEEE